MNLGRFLRVPIPTPNRATYHARWNWENWGWRNKKGWKISKTRCSKIVLRPLHSFTCILRWWVVFEVDYKLIFRHWTTSSYSTDLLCTHSWTKGRDPAAELARALQSWYKQQIRSLPTRHQVTFNLFVHFRSIQPNFRSIADKSESLQEQYILRYCQKEKEKEKKEKKETVHMKNQEWTENGRKLNLCAADDERLKTLLEKDVKVVLCTWMYRYVHFCTVGPFRTFLHLSDRILTSF